MKSFIPITLGILLFICSSMTAMAAPPQTMNYQGFLKDSTGAAVNDSRQITFSIYDTPSKGTPLWTEVHPKVFVTRGQFSVILGEGDPPQPLALPFDMPYWLGVTVDPDKDEMIPRQPLTTSPYAFRAYTADFVSGLALADGSVTSAKLDTEYVKKGGDTMTGALALPANGLTVGTNQLAVSSGKVGIGTASPTEALDVAGNVKITGSVTGTTPVLTINAQQGVAINATSATTPGVMGTSTATSGAGVYGYGSGSGVHGRGDSGVTSSIGVDGYSNLGTGVVGSSSSGIGVKGTSTGNFGVVGSSTNSVGILGGSTNNTGVTGVGYNYVGVDGVSNTGTGVTGRSISGYGVKGLSNGNYAIYGISTNSVGIRGESAVDTGIWGVSLSPTAGVGVDGVADSAGGLGVRGRSTSGTGLYGWTSTGYAGWFDGRTVVNGILRATRVQITSDERFKQDIRPLAESLDTVSRLQGVSYSWRTDEFPERRFDSGRQIGLIAQEVEKVVPELVNTDDSGYKSVEYANMVGILVEAVKELKAQNESLRARVQALELQGR